MAICSSLPLLDSNWVDRNITAGVIWGSGDADLKLVDYLQHGCALSPITAGSYLSQLPGTVSSSRGRIPLAWSHNTSPREQNMVDKKFTGQLYWEKDRYSVLRYHFNRASAHPEHLHCCITVISMLWMSRLHFVLQRDCHSPHHLTGNGADIFSNDTWIPCVWSWWRAFSPSVAIITKFFNYPCDFGAATGRRKPPYL